MSKIVTFERDGIAWLDDVFMPDIVKDMLFLLAQEEITHYMCKADAIKALAFQFDHYRTYDTQMCYIAIAQSKFWRLLS